MTGDLGHVYRDLISYRPPVRHRRRTLSQYDNLAHTEPEIKPKDLHASDYACAPSERHSEEMARIAPVRIIMRDGVLLA